MPRLIPFPAGVRVTSRTVLAGPRTISAAFNEGMTGYVQTVQSLAGLWRLQFTFTPMFGAEAIAYRGFITALHGGANATRISIRDPDLTYASMAANTDGAHPKRGRSFSNGFWFTNGYGTKPAFDFVYLAQNQVKGDTTVVLANTGWANSVIPGHRFGFSPFYFGMHEVTEILSPRTFRIWPPLRSNLYTSNYAHLEPVMVMRPDPTQFAPPGRGISATEPATLTLTEVEDNDARALFV